MDLTRRNWLRLLPLACAGPALLAEQRSEPHTAFPTEPRDRLAVTSYPFRAFINSPTNKERKPNVQPIDLKQFPAFVAEHFGVHNVNPLLAHFFSTDAAYIAAFRKALADAGSHIVDLGAGDGYFYDSDPAVRQEAVMRGQHAVDVAQAVGSPSVRQHMALRHGQTVNVPNAAESLGKLADYGAGKNVVINLENDNPVAENPFVIVEIVEKVANPYLRALTDFGNSLIGHDPAYNQRAVSAMLPHTWNMCHVKDAVANDAGRVQKVDLAALFQLAKQAQYRGYFSMEYETEMGDPIAGTKKLIEETLTYLK